MSKRRLSLLAATAMTVVGFTSLGSREARAQWCDECVTAAVAASAEVITATQISTIAELQSALVMSLQGLDQDLSANISRVAQNASRLADAEGQRTVNLQRDLFRAAAEGGRYDIPPSLCGAATAATQVASLVGGAASSRMRLGDYGFDWSNGGGDSPSRRGPTAAARQVVSDHREITADPEMRRYDVDAGRALLNPGTATTKQMAAIRRFIQNVVDPVPIAPAVLDDDRYWPPGSEETRALYIARAARTSAARSGLEHLASMKEGVADMTGWMQAVLNNVGVAGTGTPGQANRPLPGGADGKVSLGEMLQAEVLRRWGNLNWYVSMSSSSPEVHTREMTAMMALQTEIMIEVLHAVQSQAANQALSGAEFLLRNQPEQMPGRTR